MTTIRSVLRVTEPASDRSLLSVEDLRALGITGDDAAVEAIGLRYATRIARICRIVADGAKPPTLRLESLRETFTIDETHRWRDDGALVLARRPIVTLDSVTINNDPLAIDSNLTVNDTEGMLIRSPQSRGWWGWRWGFEGGGFWRGHWGREVVVDYSAGWDEVPEDLAFGVEQYIRDVTARAGRELGLRRLTLPEVVEREYWNDATMGGVSDAVLDMLDPYINKVLF